MRIVALATLLFAVCPVSALAQSMPDDQLPISYTQNMSPHTSHAGSDAAGGGVLGNHSTGSQLGVDSLPNWSSSFYFPGLTYYGPQYTWEYTMVGHAPFGKGEDDDWRGETTWIGAPVVPVNMDLRNYDGSIRYVNGQRLYSDATQYVTPVLKSPVYSKSWYSSSEDPTQFTDALQRAEFFHKSDDEWHTLLKPRVGTTRTMVLIRGTYRFALNRDGTCCAFILVDYVTFGNALFPPTPTDTTTPIGAAENSGDIRTKDLSTFLFPNVFLYFNNDPTQCCVIGYHTYDPEPGSEDNGWREKRYVLNYSSWVSPGLFGSAFQDITALSHEVAETFNDPFITNATPWWLAPNKNCQNILETGDVVEGLPNAEYPITLNGSVWHPQNEALLQWFAGLSTSNAIDHAYSYPDTTILTAAAISQNPNCK